jgi:hypothetical protein
MNKTFIELNGRQLDVRLTLGAIEDYCDELNIKKGWEASISESPKNIRLFIYHLVKHNEVTKDELKDLAFSELNKALGVLGTGEGKAVGE